MHKHSILLFIQSESFDGAFLSWVTLIEIFLSFMIFGNSYSDAVCCNYCEVPIFEI